MKLTAWMALFAAMTVIAPAFADSPDGQQIFLHGNGAGAMPCAACHGVDADGNTSIGAPKLAGLSAGVIKSALANFAGGGGGNASMQYVAQALSPAEIDAVAAYLSSLK
ncbi:MAG: c-type cytochrome [Acidocella sp.]|nr:c-type cytochrome [Acidocella sp.]